MHVGRFDVMHQALSVKRRAGEAVFSKLFPDRRMLRGQLAEAPCNVSGVDVGSARNWRRLLLSIMEEQRYAVASRAASTVKLSGRSPRL